MAVVEVAMPTLRRAALVGSGRTRVPHVDVLELRPHSEIRVCEVEQPWIHAQAKPGIVEPELAAPRVLADDEFLACAAPQPRVAAFLLSREPRFGLGGEARRVGFELAPHRCVGDELAERKCRIALAPQ